VRVGHIVSISRKVLGSGTFGTVFLGRIVDEAVAVKVIQLNRTVTKDAVRHEAMVMHQLHHPNILHCFGCWVDAGKAYAVLEIASGDLFDHKKGFMGQPKVVISILLQIANGMAHLHSKGIIHRDLKTQNCLLTSKGIVKICDFGTAKSLSSFGGSICGTPEYCAPEVFDAFLRKDKAYKPFLQDVYSFGIMVWVPCG